MFVLLTDRWGQLFSHTNDDPWRGDERPLVLSGCQSNKVHINVCSRESKLFWNEGSEDIILQSIA